MSVYAVQRVGAHLIKHPPRLRRSSSRSPREPSFAAKGAAVSQSIPMDPRVRPRPASGTGTFGTAVLPIPTGGEESLVTAHSGYQPTTPWFSGVSDNPHASPVGADGLARIPWSNDA